MKKVKSFYFAVPANKADIQVASAVEVLATYYGSVQATVIERTKSRFTFKKGASLEVLYGSKFALATLESEVM